MKPINRTHPRDEDDFRRKQTKHPRVRLTIVVVVVIIRRKSIYCARVLRAFRKTTTTFQSTEKNTTGVT